MASPHFASSHDLPFLATEPYEGILGGVFIAFKVGTCHGLYTADESAYQMVAIINDEPGNGHFNDVLEWPENSAKRDGKALEIVEIWNDGLRQHLIKKRGFCLKDNGDVVKAFS